MKKLLACFLSIFGTAAFCIPCRLIDTAQISARMTAGSAVELVTAFIAVIVQNVSTISPVVFLLLFVLEYRILCKPGLRGSWLAFFLALFFSCLMLIGEGVETFGDAALLFSNHPQQLLSVMKLIGFSAVFYPVILYGFAQIENPPLPSVSTSKFGWPEKAARFLFETHCFWLPLGLILLFWLPYLIGFFPGFVPSDGLKQLNNFYGVGNFTDHHPAFSTMLMGWAMTLGQAAGSDALGIFFYTFPQVLLMAGGMANCFRVYQKLQTPLWLRSLTLFVFCLISIWPNYAFSLLKDSLYAALILLYVQCLIEIIYDAGAFFERKWKILLLTLVMALMMLVRHEAVYVILLSFPFLLLLRGCRASRRQICLILLIPLCLLTVFNRVIRPALHIADGTSREALNIPIRQTALCVIKHEADFSEEERTVLRDVFDYEKIPEMYNVENADELKGLFDPYADSSRTAAYLRVWFRMGLKYPLTYLNAFLSGSYKYFYPLGEPYRNIYGWFGIEQAAYVNKGLFDLQYAPAGAVLRSALINLTDTLPRLPFFSLFYSQGLYSWVLLFCLACLIRKRTFSKGLALLPALLSLMICLASPLNGFIRYMLPVMILLPLSSAWAIWAVRPVKRL